VNLSLNAGIFAFPLVVTAIISAAECALTAGSPAGFTPIILAMPGLGTPCAPWQLWHLALYTACPLDWAKPVAPAKSIAVANAAPIRTVLLIGLAPVPCGS